LLRITQSAGAEMCWVAARGPVFGSNDLLGRVEGLYLDGAAGFSLKVEGMSTW